MSPAAREARIVTLGCLLYVGGQSLFFIMPAFLALLGTRLTLDAAQLGTLAGAESLAFAFTSLVAPFWINRVDLRVAMSVGVAVVVACTVATAFAPAFGPLLALRIVVGVFGEGVLGTIGFRVLAAAHNVDRAFAVALTAAVIFGAVVMAGAAALEHALPRFGLLLAMMLMALAILPCMGWTSALTSDDAREAPATHVGAIGIAATIALIGQAVWFAAPGAFWTFAEQVAIDKGLASHAAEVLLSIGELVALVGAIVAAILADRLGRILPIAIASLGLAVSAIVFAGSTNSLVLGICLAVFYTCWNYGVVYQISFVAQLDPSGNAAVVLPAIQVIGLAIGPYVAGELIAGHGDLAVMWSTLAFTFGGFAFTLVALARSRRNPIAVPA